MSKDELSLETRASTTYVQGELAELITAHEKCPDTNNYCGLWKELAEVLNDWKQDEAKLKALKEPK